MTDITTTYTVEYGMNSEFQTDKPAVADFWSRAGNYVTAETRSADDE